jgi:hypothetical protein
MARTPRRNVGLLLVIFMLIDIAIWLYTATAGAQLNAHIDLTAQQAGWTIIDGALVWRVWRGARWAWLLLIAMNAALLAELLIGGAWTFYVIALYAFLYQPALDTPEPGGTSSRPPGPGCSLVDQPISSI